MPSGNSCDILFLFPDLTCSEMASSYNTAIAKVDLILEKLAEIPSLETPPSEEIVEFCEAASADFNALK